MTCTKYGEGFSKSKIGETKRFRAYLASKKLRLRITLTQKLKKNEDVHYKISNGDLGYNY